MFSDALCQAWNGERQLCHLFIDSVLVCKHHGLQASQDGSSMECYLLHVESIDTGYYSSSQQGPWRVVIHGVSILVLNTAGTVSGFQDAVALGLNHASSTQSTQSRWDDMFQEEILSVNWEEADLPFHGVTPLVFQAPVRQGVRKENVQSTDEDVQTEEVHATAST